MTTDIREELIDQLSGEHAHISFKSAVGGLSIKEAGSRPESQPYSIWELVEHIRISQSDILVFCTNPDYTAPEWPDEYWPTEQAPADQEAWEQSLDAIENDTRRMVELVNDRQNDLFEPFPHGDGQTLFRETVLIIDHTSYHTGQIVSLRRQMGIWR